MGFTVTQLNSTHARVKIKPTCHDDMEMFKTIELRYCLKGDDFSCKSVQFGGHCSKVCCHKIINSSSRKSCNHLLLISRKNN